MYVFLNQVAKQVTKEQLFNRLNEQLADSPAFFGHAVIDEQDETMMVMMKVFQQGVDNILSTGDERVTEQQVEACQDLVDKRIATLKPMAYVVGEVFFAGMKFCSDERALVPRSPLAELIINGFEKWQSHSTLQKALDLCTGGGCIGLALAHHYPESEVHLSDISSTALQLAASNRDQHQLQNRVSLICSDLFEQIDDKYDLILSNPPYVSLDEYQALPDEYKHEPQQGLVTELDGLRIPVEILYQSAGHLQSGGHLFLEVGYTDELLENAFPTIDFEWLEFFNGGQGVCVFSQKKLLEYRSLFKQYLETSTT